MKTIQTFLLIAAVVTITSCGKKKVQIQPDQPFCLSDTMKKKVTLAAVTYEKVKNAISLSGKIQANEDQWVKVFPVVSGVVEDLKVELGDYVQKGQTLAVIKSSDIADFQSQLSVAESNLNTAEKSLKSNEEMFAAGLATERDVVTSKNDLAKAQSDLKRAKEVAGIYGVQNNASQVIKAPVSGFVVEKNITENMQYKADGSQPFFVISNLDEVWVMANVFESDISKIKVGYDADINVIAYKDKHFSGKVDRIFSVLDPDTRVMHVRIKIPNKDYLLKPEMFAQINIKYEDDSTKQSLAIPSKAIIFDKDKNFVMVYKNNCNIETREINVLQSIGDTTYIQSGLDAGEKIITTNQLLIYDALND